MSNELIKETIALNQNIGKETTQVLMEGDFIVPDIKPDISEVLQADAEVNLDKTDVSADRINFSGKLSLYVLYRAKGSENLVHSMDTLAVIEDFINMDGISRDMWVDLSCSIANIDYKVLNDRKISYRVIIDVTIAAETRITHDIITTIKDLPDTQLIKRPLLINKTVESRADRFVVKDELPISPGKPNIREILQTNIAITNKETKVGNGRVHVNGELVISTLYKGDDGESIIEFIEHEAPFNGSIDAPAAREGMFGDVTLRVAERLMQIKKDSDGEDRILGMETTVAAVVKVYSQNEIQVLADAYCINQNIDMVTETVKYPRLVCRNKNQCPVKEVVQLDMNCPDILQIFRVTGAVVVDDVKILDDKVAVEGIINTNILYIANKDETPLYNFKTSLPYKQVIETRGAAPGMEVVLECGIEHTSFNMLSGREIELRFLTGFNTRVIEQLESGVITDIRFSDMDRAVIDCMPSMTIYVVQKGDTLWNIAKRFNTSMEELIDVNEIDEPDKIYPGQKLLILKKVII